MVFISQSEADEVLNFYENRIMSIDNVTYAAVIKNIITTDCGEKNFGYKLEIGTMAKDSVKINPNIKPFDAYIGNWGINQIPKNLPVPSKYEQYLKYSYKIKNNKGPIYKLKIKDKRYNHSAHVQKIELYDYIAKESIDFKESLDMTLPYFKRQKKEVFIEDDKNWMDYPLGSQPIKTYEGQSGTLGGVFQLLEFPNKLFGISNWHVIAGRNAFLGQEIYSHNDNKSRGNLFWHSIDIEREVGFISFNDTTAQEYKDKYHPNDIIWTLGTPQIGMPVYQEGYGQDKDKSHQENRGDEILSINATIKRRDSLLPNEIKIFKHQLLIERIHQGGASGALVFKKEADCESKIAVGLLFATAAEWTVVGTDSKPKARLFSVANNLSKIFNYQFKLKQEVYKGKETTGPYNGNLHVNLVDRFTLSERINLNYLNKCNN